MTMPVTAVEDWANAVTATPMIKSNKGKLIAPKRFMQKDWISWAEKASFMTAKPKNKRPKPHKISPIDLIFSRLMKVIMMPIKAKASKYSEIGNEENEAMMPVTVVPI